MPSLWPGVDAVHGCGWGPRLHRPPARQNWDGFPRSVRKSILGWIVQAKRDRTRARQDRGDRPNGAGQRAREPVASQVGEHDGSAVRSRPRVTMPGDLRSRRVACDQRLTGVSVTPVPRSTHGPGVSPGAAPSAGVGSDPAVCRSASKQPRHRPRSAESGWSSVPGAPCRRTECR
jgi:hypothetical protein